MPEARTGNARFIVVSEARTGNARSGPLFPNEKKHMDKAKIFVEKKKNTNGFR